MRRKNSWAEDTTVQPLKGERAWLREEEKGSSPLSKRERKVRRQERQV